MAALTADGVAFQAGIPLYKVRWTDQVPTITGIKTRPDTRILHYVGRKWHLFTRGKESLEPGSLLRDYCASLPVLVCAVLPAIGEDSNGLKRGRLT